MSEETFVDVDNLNIKAKLYDDDWVMALMQRGVVINIDIGYWRGGVALDYQLLGLKFADNTADFVNNYIKLGTCKVFPPRILNEIAKIQKTAKDNLTQHSFKTVWGHFVPYSAFPAWEARNEEIRDNFMGYSEKIACEYHDILEEVKTDYYNLAADVWYRLNPNSKSVNDIFVDNFISQIESKIPSREKIVSSFRYDIAYYIIPLPSFLSDDISKKIKMEQLSEYELALEKETKKKISECYIEQKRNLIDGFLNSTVIYLRKYIYDVCESVLESMKGKQLADLSTSNLKKINDMVDKVNVLNIFKDEEIDLKIRELEYSVNKYYGHHNSNKILDTLVEIKNIAKASWTDDYNSSIDNYDIEDF